MRTHHLIAVAGFAIHSAAIAQTPRLISLGQPDATLTEEFTRIISIRELQDGRLIVCDSRDKRVVAVDFQTGVVAPVGRLGQGPGEYGAPGQLIPLAADSTLLADPANSRWLLLSGARPVATIPSFSPAVRLAETPTGADASHVLGRRRGPQRDSVTLILVARATGHADTIARLAPQEIGVGPMKVSSNLTTQHLTISTWSAGEQAVLFTDGWVAIARLHPYRVDWRTPGGNIQLGAALPNGETPMDAAEKKAFMERLARGTGKPPKSVESRDDWPPEIPPFSSFTPDLTALGGSPALFAAPAGHLAIFRMPIAAKRNPHYDVIDRNGKLVAELDLAADERLAGFGAQSAYTIVTDDDGVQRLRRYRWPIK